MPEIEIKWGKEKIKVHLDRNKTGKDFKDELQSLTGVPSSRQKISGIGRGLLKDETLLDKVKISKRVMMMGTAESLPEKPVEKIVFAEDLVDHEDDVHQRALPSGLKNLGNTCYLSSAIHMLRMIPELGEALKNYKGSSTSMNITEKLTGQLRDMWLEMDKIDNGNPYIPYGFVDTVRKAYPRFAQKEDTPIGPSYVQQDADEFLNTLKQTLFEELSSTDPNLKKKFVGKMMVKFTNQEIDEDVTEQAEDFHKLSCYIKKDTLHLVDGIESGLQGSVERKSNKLARNAIHTKSTRVVELPKYVTINSVRFYWKQKDQINAKILKKVRFPPDLDVSSFCHDDLKETIQANRAKKLEIEKEILDRKRTQMSKAENDDPMDTSSDPVAEIPTPLGYYELVSVITHEGRTVDSGHYMCYCKGPGKYWTKFNDDRVSEVTLDQVKDLCGGGDGPIAVILLYREKESHS